MDESLKVTQPQSEAKMQITKYKQKHNLLLTNMHMLKNIEIKQT